MCPSPYIIIYGPHTLLNTVDKNRITRLAENTKVSLLSTYITKLRERVSLREIQGNIQIACIILINLKRSF